MRPMPETETNTTCSRAMPRAAGGMLLNRQCCCWEVQATRELRLLEEVKTAEGVKVRTAAAAALGC